MVVTGGDRTALEALRLRLKHTEVIARLIARSDDSDLTQAVSGVVALLTDAGDDLAVILAEERD